MVKTHQGPRHIANFDSGRLPALFTDVLVVGSGIAGLSAAIEASRHGKVMLVSKAELSESNTYYAQGGIARPCDDKDMASHFKDTVQAGQGITDENAAKYILKNAPMSIEELVKAGVEFDRNPEGQYDLAKEGGHSGHRILHCGGDSTGTGIEKAIIKTVRSLPDCTIMENTFVIDILTRDGACIGCLMHNTANGLFMTIAKSVIVATGGAGKVYRETTNPDIATGDGVAMAYRAGCEISDMEFMQFHPTTLYVAGAVRALISEVARGEGGRLVDKNGFRFMKDKHPMGDLAPRDVVSRAILEQMRLTSDTNVYLDMRHLPAELLDHRFPKLKELCSTFRIDMKKDLIPVRPSAHYSVGGIKTDLKGRTSLKRLYACGEAACTGFHGANRLGSNSLLEGLVMGLTSGREAAKEKGPIPILGAKMNYDGCSRSSRYIDTADLTNSLRSLMWRNVGLERNGKDLAEAIEKIGFWSNYVFDADLDSLPGWELKNMLQVSHLIASMALEREESRGTHFRSDFPKKDDKNWQKHQVTRNTKS